MKLFSTLYLGIIILFFGSEGIIVAQKYSLADTANANKWNEQSLLHRSKGDMDSAIYCSKKGLVISKQINYKYGEAKALYYLGIVTYVRGNFIHAIDTLTLASKIFLDDGNKKDYSSVLTVIGGVRNAMGDFPGALECQLQSVKIKESIGDSANLAASYNNIGNVYVSIDEFQKALSYFKRALKLNVKYKNIDKIPNNYYSIASTYKQQHLDSLATYNVYISIHLADSLGLIEMQSYSYGLMAGIKMDKGDLDSAVIYCLKAIAITEKIEDERMTSAHYQRLGTVYQKMGNNKKAEHYLLHALKISETINYLEEMIEIQVKLSNLYAENGNYEKALFYIKKFREAEDTILNEEKGKEIIRKEMNFEFENKFSLEKIEQEKKEAIVSANKKRQQLFIWFLVSIIIAVTIISMLVFRSLRTTKKQKAIIEKQKELVEEKQKEILDSIRYAKRIQDALLTSQSYIERNIKRLRKK